MVYREEVLRLEVWLGGVDTIQAMPDEGLEAISERKRNSRRR